jgi:ketosteroid isomerase-like protein
VSLLYSVAHAAEPADIGTEAVREVLAEYRAALEQKDIERLAALYVSFTDSRRRAQQEYFDNAADLAIEIADVTVEPHAGGLVVSYTRRDDFVDRKSRRAIRLEVRLTRVFVRQGDTWKIGGKP